MLNSSINDKIVKMRKEKSQLKTIFNWVNQWDNFKSLDEIIILQYILNVLNKNNLAVSRKEVRTIFNKYYSKALHGEKDSYLQWIYANYQIKEGTLVFSSQVRKKRVIRVISGSKSPILEQNNNKSINYMIKNKSINTGLNLCNGGNK